MLRDSNNHPVQCEVLKTSCKGLKICTARRYEDHHHHFTDRTTVTSSHRMLSAGEQTPEREVFLKTLGFFCALQEHCCPYIEAGNVDGDDLGSDTEIHALPATQFADNADLVINSGASHLSRRSNARRCHGRLIYKTDEFNQSFICCSLRSHDRPRHLLLYSVQEYDTKYLQALLEDNWDVVNKHECDARSKGYGPLMPCDYVASPSTQTQLCRKSIPIIIVFTLTLFTAHWHRLANNRLKRGTLRKWAHGCAARYHVYVPHDLHACPQILILCQSPHSHPPPAPVKTPPPLKDLFNELLLLMKWKLADATPRRIFLDTAFVEGLQRTLGWDRVAVGREATLTDLHPSLANLDHVRRLINTLRTQQYPCGTGFEGAQLLVEEQTRLPLDQRYVRCVEVHKIGRESYLKLIICMTTRMSSHLLAAKRLSIDTSFKRAQGWQEFEIESWDINHQRSVVCARAFINSQTANAHLIFFRRIFEIAMGDTGVPVMFRHIHGSGIESVVADSHKGQALGRCLGMFCVEISCDIDQTCIYEPHRQISQLKPYDHLQRFYRLCVAHFQRNLHMLKPIIPFDAYKAMRSLASSEPHPDIKATLSFIRNSHPKAAAWLKDKVDSTPFALPGLYQPASFIPLAIWKACPSTTNGNEQAHRNAYREGINLTLLAGIMKGSKYDQTAMVSIDVHSAFGINTRDAEATHAFRAARAVSRKGSS
ncbi:hypothetical protein JVT61DRAFT_4875 [Boletus reticuloceps]|uniref:Uncharacterized protein n=1 Tax=Boletus reticuloceps TaxID=495285 RepID=A0A8I2YLZ3_9AGAM|nr:hypothetical protein JVT61DRAFT_4875 [Boletus reticuloceps]